MTGKLVPEERDLAAALVEIAEKYGKFDEDQTGIWADYHEPEDNPYAEMGVKCGNCVLYRGGEECAVVAFKVNSEGYCRFAVLPDGTVDPSKAPAGVDEDVSTHEYFNKPQSNIDEYIKTVADKNEPAEVRDITLESLIPTQKTVNLRRVSEVNPEEKPIKVWASPAGFKIIDGHHRSVARKMAGETYIAAKIYYPSDSPVLAALVAAKASAPSCPAPTQDIALNIKNRQTAIDDIGYGPLNPDEPNKEFWQEKADRWKTTPAEASKSICGNCVFFIKTPSMLECISKGIEQGGSGEQNAWDAIDQADLGYCEALDFKCAASRTCNAWATGGPITEEK